MVRKRMTIPGPEMPEPEADVELLLNENSVIKSKNIEFARALSDQKQACKDMEQQRNLLQRENMNLMTENCRYQEQLKQIKESSDQVLKYFVALSGSIETLLIAVQVKSPIQFHSPTKINSTLSEHHSILKTTQAVKPMVSGHVIHRPTINLRRLPREELERIAANLSNTSLTQAASEDEPEDRTEEAEQEQDNISNHEESDETEINNEESRDRRLETLEEVDEIDATMNNTVQPPIMSGIFNDINVYIQHPTTTIPQIPIIHPIIAARISQLAASTSSPSTSQAGLEQVEELATSNIRTSTRLKTAAPSLSQLNNSTQSANISLFSPPQVRRKRKNITPVFIDSQNESSLSSTVNSDDEDNSENNTTNTPTSTMVNNWGSRSNTNGLDTNSSANNDSSTNISQELHDNDELQDSAVSNGGVSVRKLESMRVLGLSPLSKSTPYIDKESERKRTRSSVRLSQEASTPKIIKRGRKKKSPTLPSCKVMLKQLPLSKRNSLSPRKNRLSSSMNSSSESTLTNNTKLSEAGSSKIASPAKKKKKRAKKGSASSSTENYSLSPVKTRPKRLTKPVDLKEPTLNKKMRRV